MSDATGPVLTSGFSVDLAHCAKEEEEEEKEEEENEEEVGVGKNKGRLRNKQGRDSSCKSNELRIEETESQ